jgi:hypothetical protein
MRLEVIREFESIAAESCIAEEFQQNDPTHRACLYLLLAAFIDSNVKRLKMLPQFSRQELLRFSVLAREYGMVRRFPQGRRLIDFERWNEPLQFMLDAMLLSEFLVARNINLELSCWEYELHRDYAD